MLKLRQCPSCGNTRLHNPRAKQGTKKSGFSTRGDCWNCYLARSKLYCREKRKDPVEHLSTNLRSLVSKSYKKYKPKERKRLDQVLGCSVQELSKRFELLFKPGMGWHNLGKEWECDHRLPLSAAKTAQDLDRLWHYSNLQPLWITENRLKNCQYDRHALTLYLSQ